MHHPFVKRAFWLAFISHIVEHKKMEERNPKTNCKWIECMQFLLTRPLPVRHRLNFWWHLTRFYWYYCSPQPISSPSYSPKRSPFVWNEVGHKWNNLSVPLSIRPIVRLSLLWFSIAAALKRNVLNHANSISFMANICRIVIYTL